MFTWVVFKGALVFWYPPTLYAKPRVGDWQHPPARSTRNVGVNWSKHKVVASLSHPQPANSLMPELSLCCLTFLPEACCWKHIYEIFNECVLWNASGRKFSRACLANDFLRFIHTTEGLSAAFQCFIKFPSSGTTCKMLSLESLLLFKRFIAWVARKMWHLSPGV